MALGDVIARLSVSLGLETAAFEKGARKATQEVSSLERGMSRLGKVGAAIGAAFLASGIGDLARAWSDATKAALDFAGGLGEQAQQLGVTTNELQEYRYVASQVGIEQDAMDKGLAKLSITLGDVAAGAKAPTEALKALGLSAAEIQRVSEMTAGEALPFLADKFTALDNATQEAAIAADLFGSKMGGRFLTLLNEGAAGLEKMREEAHRLGIVISEEAIKNADANADLLSTYEQMAKAQETATLTMPENVRAFMAYQKAVTDVKLGFYEAIGGINEFGNALTKTLRDFGKESGIQGFFKNFNATVSDWARRMHDAITAIPAFFSAMVAAIRSQVSGALESVWNRAIDKLGALGEKFRWLYDVVVGHSYIPDMVDGIAAQMARLDAVMVKPAEKATEATARKFRDLRDLMSSLFPEIDKRNTFNAELAALQSKDSGLTGAALDEAVQRLWRKTVSGSPFGSGGMGGPDFGDAGPLVEGMGKTEDAIERLTEKSKIGTVRIAQSFADMAQDTLQSLSRLTSAIKGGGFLDIVSAVVDLGLQLAGSGAFGKSAQSWANQPVKGFAQGTISAPSGWAWTGENGPELVRFRGGERVYNNKDSRGMMGGNVYHISGNLLTPEFWERIQAGDLAAMQGGAAGGVAAMTYRQSRRVG